MADVVLSQAQDGESYDPPMPVLSIGISRPGTGTHRVAVDALVDTGADGTLMPLTVLEEARAPYVDRAFLRGITGVREPVDLYLASVHIGDLHVHGVRIAAIPPGSEAILGRDVLNQLRLLLDGIAGVTEVR